MNSLELLKKKESSVWWNAIIVVIIYSIIQGLAWDFVLKPYVNNGLIGNLLSFVFGLVFILLWVKFSSYEKNSLETLGFHKEKISKNISLGLICGAVASFIIIMIVFLFGGFSFKFASDGNIFISIVILVLFLVQGLVEEVVFRGYLMNRIASTKGRWWGVFGNSIFFAIFHAANNGISYLSSLNIFLTGFMLSLLFWYSDNIYLVGAFHGIWNGVIGVIFGINISGIEVTPTILKATNVSENIYLSGGSFGVEGSGVTTGFLIIATLFIYMGLYVQMFSRLAKKNKETK